MSNYIYNIGDIIKVKSGYVKILNKIRTENNIKGYKYLCLNDNTVNITDEYRLRKGIGCPVCANKKIIKGINDIVTTNKELVQYFVNKQDAYKYASNSNKKVLVKCPVCGNVQEMIIQNLHKRGFSCNVCGDGVSFPEKLMASVLKYLNIEFITQYSSSNAIWCGKYRYDFYLPELNCIIETHGSQHYNKSFESCGGKSLQEQIKIDKLKYDLAIANGIDKYIIIDSRKSSFDFIKENIINSELSSMIDIKSVNWNTIEQISRNSIMEEIVLLWKSGYKVPTISSMLKYSNVTIQKYLNIANDMGLCIYDTYSEKYLKGSKRVLCINNNKVYNSITECSRLSELDLGEFISEAKISRVCNGKQESTGIYRFNFV